MKKLFSFRMLAALLVLLFCGLAYVDAAEACHGAGRQRRQDRRGRVARFFFRGGC